MSQTVIEQFITQLPANPLFYLTAIPAILIVGIAKGGLGGGLGMIGVPLMTLTMPPFQAAAIMLPILIVMDAHALWNYRNQGDWDNLRILIPAAILGIVIGTFTFNYLSAAQIRIMIGIIAVTFVLNHFLRPNARQKSGVSISKGSFWGMVSGFTSFGVHAGGPPINVYLLPQQLDKTVFQATTVTFFTIVNLVKLVPYGWLGQFNTENLGLSLLLAPLAPIGISIGYYLHHRIDQKLFFRVVYISLLIVGSRLIYVGIRAH